MTRKKSAGDRLTRHERSALMSRIGSRNTAPELTVRRLLFGVGYRYRIHVRGLPGSPDIVFASRKKAIFVHGCFWHRHACRKGRSVPATRTSYWEAKFAKTRKRDSAARRRLKTMGWQTLVVWECQLRDADALLARLTRFLG